MINVGGLDDVDFLRVNHSLSFYDRLVNYRLLGFRYLMSTILILGVGGNLSVIYVFTVRWRSPSTYSFYSACQAFLQLAKCVSLAPFFLHFVTPEASLYEVAPIICQIFRSMIVFFLAATTFLLLLTSICLFRQVQYPWKIHSVSKTTGECLAAIVLGFFISLPVYGVYTASSLVNPELDSFKHGKCALIHGYRNTVVARTYLWIVIVVFSVAMLTNTVIYILTSRNLMKRQQSLFKAGSAPPSVVMSDSVEQQLSTTLQEISVYFAGMPWDKDFTTDSDEKTGAYNIMDILHFNQNPTPDKMTGQASQQKRTLTGNEEPLSTDLANQLSVKQSPDGAVKPSQGMASSQGMEMTLESSTPKSVSKKTTKTTEPQMQSFSLSSLFSLIFLSHSFFPKKPNEIVDKQQGQHSFSNAPTSRSSSTSPAVHTFSSTVVTDSKPIPCIFLQPLSRLHDQQNADLAKSSRTHSTSRAHDTNKCVSDTGGVSCKKNTDKSNSASNKGTCTKSGKKPQKTPGAQKAKETPGTQKAKETPGAQKSKHPDGLNQHSQQQEQNHFNRSSNRPPKTAEEEHEHTGIMMAKSPCNTSLWQRVKARREVAKRCAKSWHYSLTYHQESQGIIPFKYSVVFFFGETISFFISYIAIFILFGDEVFELDLIQSAIDLLYFHKICYILFFLCDAVHPLLLIFCNQSCRRELFEICFNVIKLGRRKHGR